MTRHKSSLETIQQVIMIKQRNDKITKQINEKWIIILIVKQDHNWRNLSKPTMELPPGNVLWLKSASHFWKKLPHMFNGAPRKIDDDKDHKET